MSKRSLAFFYVEHPRQAGDTGSRTALDTLLHYRSIAIFIPGGFEDLRCSFQSRAVFNRKWLTARLSISLISEILFAGQDRTQCSCQEYISNAAAANLRRTKLNGEKAHLGQAPRWLLLPREKRGGLFVQSPLRAGIIY